MVSTKILVTVLVTVSAILITPNVREPILGAIPPALLPDPVRSVLRKVGGTFGDFAGVARGSFSGESGGAGAGGENVDTNGDDSGMFKLQRLISKTAGGGKQQQQQQQQDPTISDEPEIVKTSGDKVVQKGDKLWLQVKLSSLHPKVDKHRGNVHRVVFLDTRADQQRSQRKQKKQQQDGGEHDSSLISFTLGKKDVIPGIEMAFDATTYKNGQTITVLERVGDRAEFAVGSKHAFGHRGFTPWGLESKETLLMDIEVVAVE